MPIERPNEKEVEAKKTARLFVERLERLENRTEYLTRNLDTVTDRLSDEVDRLHAHQAALFITTFIIAAALAVLALKLSGVF